MLTQTKEEKSPNPDSKIMVEPRKNTVDRAWLKNSRKWYNSGKKLRRLIQYGFFLTSIVIGVQFVIWYKYYAIYHF